MHIHDKIQYFKKLKIFCLVATPRSGSDYFQSLLDGHPEVLTFNGSIGLYVNFFSKINFKNNNKKNLIHAIKSFIRIYKNWLYTKNDKIEGKNKLGKNKNDFINIDLNKYEYAMYCYLLSEGFTKKNFSLAAYFAYNICLGANFKNKKVLLMHPHNLDELVLFSNDFKKNRYLFTIRDQRAGYFSTVYNMSDRFPEKYYNLRHHYVTIYRCLIHSSHGDNLGLKYKCIRLEDLPHKNTLILISKLLNIKFNKSLLKSTFAGKDWNGDTSQKVSYKDNWEKNRTYNNWKEKLSKRDQLILNCLFIHIIKHYNYELPKLTYYDYMKCFVLIFLPMEFEKNVLIKNILSIFFEKNKKKNYSKLVENLYFLARRVLICLNFYFANFISIKKIKSKYIKAKIPNI